MYICTGLSLALAIDLCVRHGLVSQLEALLFPLPEEGVTAAASDDVLLKLLEEVSPFIAAVLLHLP